MTNLPPNAEELVSAYLDGEAAPDEVAIVEANDELLARVEQLRALTGPMTAPLAAPPEMKEAHLAAALGLFDELAAAPSEEEATANAPLAEVHTLDAKAATRAAPVTESAEAAAVASLESARERRQKRRGLTGLIAAAVALVLVFAGLAALGGSNANDVATEASTAASEADTASDASDDGGSDTLEFGSADDVEAPAASLSDRTSADSADSDEEAMEEEAMEEEAMAEAAPEVEDAMEDDEAMADEDDAAGSAPVESAEEPAAGSPADGDRRDFFLGIFEDTDELGMFLETEGRDRASPLEDELLANRWASEGLFPSCQAEVTELIDNPGPSLVGVAEVGGQAVELHRSSDNETLVVDVTTCGLLDRLDQG